MTTDKLCYKCNKNAAGGPERISFKYRGIRFSIYKDGMTCFDCEKKSAIKMFKEHGSKFVSIEKGKIAINWSKFVADYEREDNLYTHALRDIGILSFNAKGNWEMDANGICINPVSIPAGFLYFVREEDMREFAKIKGTGTQYPWVIRRFNEVFSKSEVLA